MESVSRILCVGWRDADMNGHMRNTAFLDHVNDVRMMFFAQQGFTMAEFARRRIGPVSFRDELEYTRELKLFEEFRLHMELVGASPDESRFKLRNTFARMDGAVCARVTSLGGWFDLQTRKLIVPPEALLAAIQAIPRASEFEVL